MPIRSTTGSFAVSRRLVLTAMAGLPVAAALPRFAIAQESADMAFVLLSDLHSPYRKLPQLVEKVRQLAAAQPVPVRILINGDIFERGNVVALRSQVAADLAALERLAAIAPTTFNIGNHETAVLHDMNVFVNEATSRGVDVISNMVDARTGRMFAPSTSRVLIGNRRVAITGIATDNIFTYREAVRGTLVLPSPVDYAKGFLPGLLRDADAAVVLSHTGVAADRRMLDLLPSGALLVGAHDHLRFAYETPDLAYLHTGSWGNHITLAEVTLREEGGFSTRLSEIDVLTADRPDTTLQGIIDGLLEEHLTEEDRAIVGTVPEAKDLATSVLFATEAVRQATGTDVAFLGHTTFGTGLAEGPVSRYDFDAFVRFDGAILTSQVRGDQLAFIMERANQHEAASLDQRTGDFVYARTFDIDPQASYTIATNGWTARNQARYLGTTDLVFVETDGLMLKAIVADAIAMI